MVGLQQKVSWLSPFRFLHHPASLLWLAMYSCLHCCWIDPENSHLLFFHWELKHLLLSTMLHFQLKQLEWN
uniref:Eukaryotic translation initiation factor 3 subunit n=1 Tax=Rhizophora mucronata TaxID=61149 RepID=A0A2P2JDT1_RHIMU